MFHFHLLIYFIIYSSYFMLLAECSRKILNLNLEVNVNASSYLLRRWFKSLNFLDDDFLQSVQISSAAQSCPTFCNPMDCSTPNFPVHHQLQELAQACVHWVDDVIQPSHPLSASSPPAFSCTQHKGLFQWVSSLHQVDKVLEFQL